MMRSSHLSGIYYVLEQTHEVGIFVLQMGKLRIQEMK